MLRRVCLYLTFAAAAAAGVAGILILLSQFIDWLQGNPRPNFTLLRVALEHGLVPTIWPHFPVLANLLFTVLHAIPVSACLLVSCPLLWAAATRLKRVL